MALLRSDVEKIAHLARLAIPPEETARYAQELSRILDLVAQMDAVSTQGVKPMAHPLHMATNDRVELSLVRSRIIHRFLLPTLAVG